VRDKLFVSKVNEVFARVACEPSIAQELTDHMTFTVPGAKFMPSVRNKFWDGKIRLYSTFTGLVYLGLIKEVRIFAKTRDYEIEFDDGCRPSLIELTDTQVEKFLTVCNLTLTPRDYQLNAFRHAIQYDRGVFLSPTASGKSLIIYLITRFYNANTLIIVPTTSLVSQLASDFADYGFDADTNVHRIYSGQDKQTNKSITISTWQSIYKMDKKYFQQFDVVIGDEAHLFKAKSLTTIMEKLVDCKYRFGFTGTLDGSQTNKMVLEGLFGPVHKVTTTAELMEQKHIADMKIKALVLSYKEEERKLVKNYSYQDEVDFIVRHQGRNKFLRNLALSLEGNSLILFQFVEKHGKILFDMIKDKEPNRPIFFIHGGVDGEEREQIRHIVEKENNAIIVASYGTFSTGINIRNLHNVVFSSPTKSRVRTLQSIGRGLRLGTEKSNAVIYDIADDLKHKARSNFTLLHFMERLNIYNSESFDYKIYNTDI
jgi:superfamily II DNA or RNA helicase